VPLLLVLLPWAVVVLLAAGLVLLWRALARRDAALDQAKASYERLSRAVESASDAIGIADAEGNSVYHNKAHMALFGYTVDELNRTPGGGGLFAEPSVAREIFQAVQAKRSWIGETEINTRDGRRVPVDGRVESLSRTGREAGSPILPPLILPRQRGRMRQDRAAAPRLWGGSAHRGCGLPPRPTLPARGRVCDPAWGMIEPRPLNGTSPLAGEDGRGFFASPASQISHPTSPRHGRT